MSSSPTAPTSTTASSTSSPSRPEDRLALVACGALAQPCADAAGRHGWPVDVVPLPPLLHDRPGLIADRVEALGTALAADHAAVAVGYADCGTYGALDEVCARHGWARLPGLHCYDLYAGADRLRGLLEQEPGTYVLTDFLVRSFARTVVAELGLDRHPELRPAYFGHYTRAVWLAQHPDADLRRRAEDAAATLGLPLTVLPTGTLLLEEALGGLVDDAGLAAAVTGAPAADAGSPGTSARSRRAG